MLFEVVSLKRRDVVVVVPPVLARSWLLTVPRSLEYFLDFFLSSCFCRTVCEELEEIWDSEVEADEAEVES